MRRTFLFGLLLLATSLSAQIPERVLEQAKAATSGLKAHRDPETVRKCQLALDPLRALVEASERVRREALRYLRSIVDDCRDQESLLRVRVRAVEIFAILASEAADATWALEVANEEPRDAAESFQGFVEAAFSHSKSAEVAEGLARCLLSTNRRSARMALFVLAHMPSAFVQPVASSKLEALLTWSRDSEVEMEARAVEVLARLGDSRAFGRVVEAARSREARVRLAAARGLRGRSSEAGVLAILGRLWEDPIARVREESLAALDETTPAEVVAVLISRLSKEPLRIRATIADRLKLLTHRDFPPEALPWESWLKSARASAEGLGPAVPGFSGQAPRYATSYYGIPVLSDRLVFVLDVSGSMDFRASTPKAPTRLSRAKEELTRALKSLDKRSEFNLLTFSSTVQVWKKSDLVAATSENVQDALKFLEKQHAGGGTNSHLALSESFARFSAMDTIYFLSDGSPTLGTSTVQERIVDEVIRWNRLRGVRIHTVALLTGDAPTATLALDDHKEDASRFMRLLAERTQGHFLMIP